MASTLTAEQKAKIEENRRLAIAKRAAKLAQFSANGNSILPKQVQTDNGVKLGKASNYVHITGTANNYELSNSSGSKPTTTAISGSSSKSFVPVKYNQCNNSSVNKPTTSSAISYSSTSSAPTNRPSNVPLPSYSKNISPKKPSSSYSQLTLNFIKSNQTNPVASSPPKQYVKNVNLIRDRSGKVPVNPINGVCKLISKDRFTVEIPYHEETINLFRTVNGKEYDSKTRLWTFPLKEYFNWKKAVSVLKPHVVISDLPKCVIETFITKTREFQIDSSKVDISRVDEQLKQTIYPFQKEGIQFGVSKNGRCLIADDMGLGKSIQALGIASYYRSDWPLLIVCPSSMRFQWEEEIRIHLPNSVHTHQVFIMSTGKDVVNGAQVLILSFDLLAKKKDLLKTMGFGFMIIDESHSIKSAKTQRGKAALEMSEICKRVLLLSGTPVLSRPAELYTQIKAIDKSAFPYFKEYGIRYCDGSMTKFGWNFSGSSNMEELRLLLEARFMIRRLKCNVLTQLPSKVRQVIVLNNRSLTKNNESMDAFALKLQSSSLKGMERHGCLLSYFSETAKTKSAAVCEYITDLIQDNRKFLCFAHHSEMMDAVSETLEKNKTFYIRIDGSTSSEERKVLCDKFQYEDKWMVAVLSIKAANTGLTLTAAQVVVFAELFWNPGDLVQAEDRVHRIGQEDCVVVKYLIAKGTADDYLWPLIQNKLDILNKAGLSKERNMAVESNSLQKPDGKQETQTKIDDFFQDPFDDEYDEELLKVLDEVEGVQEKKIKLDC